MWARIGTLTVIAVAACYSPSPSPGAPCGPGGSCPEGLRCSAENLCVDTETPDSGVDQDGPPPITDGPPDAPRKRWQIVQSEGAMGNDVTIDPTQGGTTLLVGIETSPADSVESLTDNANNVYAVIPASRAINTGENAVEIWMAKDANAGATTLVATGQVISSVVVWEVANLAPDPVEAVDTLSDQATSTTPAGVNITTTERGQFVLSILIVANTIGGLVPGSDFTNDHSTFGNGWAHLTDDNAPPGEYQPQWTQPMTGTSCASSVVLRTAD